ncbi:MAG: winged helix-turn-helix domain-containing protein [Myxococcota bacterium]
MLRVGDRTVDLIRLKINGPDGTHSLTKREGELLKYLADRQGQTISQEELLREVWGYAPTVSSRAAYHTVARLRKRLEPDATNPRYLVTVRGLGFRLVLPSDSPGAMERSERRAPKGLPRRRTVFFGRQAELEHVVSRLRTAPSPVVSLVGLGGIGKSRLALEVCHELQNDFDDVVFCNVTEVSNQAMLMGTLGRLLRVPLPADEIAVETLARHLAERGAVLLVLDNIERVVDLVADLALTLIDGCPDLHVLVTGRQGLELHGELQVVLDVLPPPPDDANLTTMRRNGAVRLFVDRVGLREPFALDDTNMRAVRTIVRRLEGWPLALELAAAQVPIVGLGWLEKQSSDVRNLRTTARDRPQHQRTVDDALLWTWDLLDPVSRELWLQLSWFRQGFTLQAADQVAAIEEPVATALATLRERGLIRRSEQTEEVRFTMLEPVREWARARLSDVAPIAERHAAWAVALCQHVARMSDGAAATALVTTEFENLELAWETAVSSSPGTSLAELALGMTRSAWWFGGLEPMRQRLLVALEHAPERAALWHWAGCFASRTRPLSEATRALRRAVEVAEHNAEPPQRTAVYQQHLAVLLSWQGDHGSADVLFEEAHRASPPGSRFELSVLSNWSMTLAALGRPRAIDVGKRAVRLCHQHQDELGEAIALHNLGKAYLTLEQHADAQDVLKRALELTRTHGASHEAVVLCTLGAAYEQEPARALALLTEASQIADRHGELRTLAEIQARLARLHLSAMRFPEAYDALEIAEQFTSNATAAVVELIEEVRAALRDG